MTNRSSTSIVDIGRLRFLSRQTGERIIHQEDRSESGCVRPLPFATPTGPPLREKHTFTGSSSVRQCLGFQGESVAPACPAQDLQPFLGMGSRWGVAIPPSKPPVGMAVRISTSTPKIGLWFRSPIGSEASLQKATSTAQEGSTAVHRREIAFPGLCRALFRGRSRVPPEGDSEYLLSPVPEPGSKFVGLKRPSDFSHGQHPIRPLCWGRTTSRHFARGPKAGFRIRERQAGNRGSPIRTQGSRPSEHENFLRAEGTLNAAQPLRLGKGFITAQLCRESGGPQEKEKPRRSEATPAPRTPAEGFHGSGFSFRGVQPVISRRSFTARGFPPTAQAMGLAGEFLSY